MQLWMAFAQYKLGIEHGVDGPLVMVSVNSACGPATLEKNLMELSARQFGKKTLKLM